MLTVPDIEAFCASAGITPAELLREAGIHPTQWGRWKAGKFSPRFASMAAIQAAMDARREGVAA